MPDSNLIRKKVENVKFKYSPQKKNLNKYNQVFVKEYKFGLLSLQLKKGNYSFIWYYGLFKKSHSPFLHYLIKKELIQMKMPISRILSMLLKTILKLRRSLVLSSSVILGILLNVIYLKSKGLDRNAAKFFVLHLKRKKTMVVSGKLGLKKSFII